MDLGVAALLAEDPWDRGLERRGVELSFAVRYPRYGGVVVRAGRLFGDRDAGTTVSVDAQLGTLPSIVVFAVASLIGGAIVEGAGSLTGSEGLRR